MLLAGSSFAASTRSPLADAAEKSDRASIRTLLKQRVEVNAPQIDGMTALHWAAYLDDLETAKLLLKAKGSVDSGNAPLNGLSSGTLRLGRIPVICAGPGLYDELLLQTQNTFGNAGCHTNLAISTVNQGHPLAAGKSGTIEIVDPGLTATVNSSALPNTVGTNAISIATNATPGIDVGRINTWGFERGSLLANNSTLALSRRLAGHFVSFPVNGIDRVIQQDSFTKPSPSRRARV